MTTYVKHSYYKAYYLVLVLCFGFQLLQFLRFDMI